MSKIKLKFVDFYTAFHYLNEHKIFDKHFMECLDIDVVKVNPITHEIDDDCTKNTFVEVWFECGQYDPMCCWHDIDLDCGGSTYEEAIINLANLVYAKYQ